MTTVYQWALDSYTGVLTFEEKVINVRETRMQYRAVREGFFGSRRALDKECMGEVTTYCNSVIYSSLHNDRGVALEKIKEWCVNNVSSNLGVFRRSMYFRVTGEMLLPSILAFQPE